MLLDVFKSDAFNLTSLTKAINDIPYAPTKISRLGLFSSEPITTTSVVVERQGDVLSLVPNAPRGSRGAQKSVKGRNARTFHALHLPQMVGLMADEVQNVRAFGSQSEEELAMSRLTKKLAVAKRDTDITIEYQRIGAIKGQVLDADGVTVLADLFAEFGLTQQTLSMALSNSATKVLQKIITAKRMMEDKLGGLMYSDVRVECSPEFMDAFTGHPVVQDAWRYYQSQMNAQDYRNDFRFGGVIWSEYRGQVGSTRFIEANAAYMIPVGIPDLLVTNFAPAPYMDTVNTEGLPYYAVQETKDFNVGVDVQTQSNPLHLNTRPDAFVKLTA